jgi:adenylyltransferase/sulfurtransferase
MKTRQDMIDSAKAAIREVTIQDVKETLEKGQKPLLLDVRGREEYEAGHLIDAVHVPRGLLELEVEQALPDKSRPVVIYCAGGIRSALAAQTLKEMGYRDVASMLGGYDEWAGAQYPVERQPEGKEQAQALEREIALLERQVEEKRKRLTSLKE